MAKWTNEHLDQRIFQTFVKNLGIYPIGSLVRLSSRRLGGGVDNNPALLLKPKVKVFFSTKSDTPPRPEVLNLANPGYNENIIAIEDPGDWKFPDFNLLWTNGIRHPSSPTVTETRYSHYNGSSTEERCKDIYPQARYRSASCQNGVHQIDTYRS